MWGQTHRRSFLEGQAGTVSFKSFSRLFILGWEAAESSRASTESPTRICPQTLGLEGQL